MMLDTLSYINGSIKFTPAFLIAFTSIFANEYENAIDEAKKLLKNWRNINEVEKLVKIWKGREEDEIYEFESAYALGLAYIVAEAARLGKTVNGNDADAILNVATSALTINPQVNAILAHFSRMTMPIKVLRSLGDKAPQYYLVMLAKVTEEALGKDKHYARSVHWFVYDTLEYILSDSNSFNRLTKTVWPLMIAVKVCSDLLILHMYQDITSKEKEVENIVKSMCNLLNALKKESNELAIIAEAYALGSVLVHPIARNFMNEYCYDPVTRTVEVLKSLEELTNKSDELLKNEHFMNWIKFFVIGSISQQKIRIVITDIETLLMLSLAEYKFRNCELDEASKLFNEVVKVSRSIDNWENYMAARAWFLRAKFTAEVIKARSIKEYANIASNFDNYATATMILGHNYFNFPGLEKVIFRNMCFFYRDTFLYALFTFPYIEDVYLASVHASLVHHIPHPLDFRWDVLTSLMLELLLDVTTLGDKSAETKYEGHIITAYKNYIDIRFLPALKLALKLALKPIEALISMGDYAEASIKECKALKALKDRNICRYAFLAVKGNSDALKKLRDSLDVKSRELVQGLDGKALVQLLAPRSSECRLAFMLYALVKGNIELAKKHALWGSKVFNGLVGRLFGDVYETCCDMNSERLKLALLKLYYLHI
jgi:hypothetical protein